MDKTIELLVSGLNEIAPDRDFWIDIGVSPKLMIRISAKEYISGYDGKQRGHKFFNGYVRDNIHDAIQELLDVIKKNDYVWYPNG